MDAIARDYMETLTDIEKIYFIVGLISYSEFTNTANKDKTGTQLFGEVKSDIIAKLNSLDFDSLNVIMNKYVELTKPTTS